MSGSIQYIRISRISVASEYPIIYWHGKTGHLCGACCLFSTTSNTRQSNQCGRDVASQSDYTIGSPFALTEIALRGLFAVGITNDINVEEVKELIGKREIGIDNQNKKLSNRLQLDQRNNVRH